MTLKNSKNLKITPMMEQYNKIKKQYPDAFLFYRIGDFYELFYDDAVKGSQLLELTLTSRNKNSKNSVPMCGVPYHAVKNYIDILVSKGYKIAICEQMENPATAIGMVKREVVRLITPGTFMNDDANNAKSNNYLTSIYYKNNTYGFAYCDLSTGELKTTYLDNIKDLFNEIINLQTKETIVSKDISKDILNFLKKKNILISYSNIPKKMNSISEINFVTEHLNNEFEIKATSQLIFYLFSTQKRSLNHLQKAIEYKPSFFLKIDHNAKQNLEILSSLRTNSKKGSLLYLLDKTKTAMGGRLLKQWLDRPLLNVDEIKSRQRQVNILLKNFIERKQLQDYLIKVYDLERLAGKVSFGNANGRDLIRLKISLDQIPKIKEILSKINVHGVFDKICFNLDPINDVRNLIEKSIDSDVSLSLKDGNVIKSGYNKELDKYKDAIKNGRKWIAKIENKEREKTGIKKLKIGFNKVFGYYIEVTKSNLQQVPLDRYIRKQTLTNSERFITLELKNTEQLILEAHDKLISLEYQLFVNIRNYIQSYIDKLQKLSHTIAYLDVIQGFALVADVNHYVCPNITNNSHDINIINGRHPVVEKFLEADYIPNSIKMFNNTNILLITGPNMSGKSTYMRQLALIVIMAQIGSFVPADEATLPIFHQIFTRIGASDDLVSGESTFMVEMMEANNALQNANENSLIIFDEIGRGTSTYDGIALAQSIIEYIHNHVHAKTLFSTHYHELTMLSKNMSDLKNIHVGAIEKNGELIFSHKIMEGSADKSYGIHVAKLAGLPIELLDRAKYILKKLEDENDNNKNTLIQESLKLGFSEDFDNKKVINKEKIVSEEKIDKKINKVIDKLKKIDLLNTTPICAINILCELKKILDEDNDV